VLKRANPPRTRRAISSEHKAPAIGFRGGRKHGRARGGGGGRALTWGTTSDPDAWRRISYSASSAPAAIAGVPRLAGDLRVRARALNSRGSFQLLFFSGSFFRFSSSLSAFRLRARANKWATGSGSCWACSIPNFLWAFSLLYNCFSAFLRYVFRIFYIFFNHFAKLYDPVKF
jgi:hypothetical protein